MVKLEEITKSKPKVSALMVTKDRNKLAKISILSFLKQTYPNKELIIIDDSESDELKNFIKTVNNHRILYYHLPSENLTLGELRNISVEKANGEYICQWDDDDLYNPIRIEVQMSVISNLKVDGCYLDKIYSWWPLKGKLSISRSRVWECTLLCRKDIILNYPNIRKGEDSAMIENILNRLVPISNTELYIYGIHGKNTWDEGHFNRQWDQSTNQFEYDTYDSIIENISSIFPVDEYLKSI